MDINEILKDLNLGLIQDFAFCKGMEARNNFRYINFYETCIYVKTIQSDLIISSNNLNKNNNEIENKFYARIICLTIYEYFNDINNILGKELSDELKEINFLEFITSLNEIGKEINQLKKKRTAFFKEIRHETIAHRNKSKTKLLEQIFNIDEEEVLDISIETIKLNTKLISLFSQITKKISQYHTINGLLKNNR
ncbi:hypothetical protein [Chryseobacterium oryctis]|uniref:HEPN AbiU2-like domain-containing protein n=1 Tax=Chryseobacterium oryctis TaxID=2952618 RepID=A0ABT3HPV9_9FLAO|nr:hypothetical protein [Chryseobacterium oryctis]MCW3161774.1 hypothetical protein [Chryseobacterium oryctis]